MFDGLQFYEIILLSLGAALFVVLLGLLVFLVLNRRTPRSILLAFPLPIAMIAFPGYETSKMGADLLEITKLTKKVDEMGSSDTAALDQLELKMEEIEVRSEVIDNPESLRAIERAQAVRDVAKIEVEAVQLDRSPESQKTRKKLSRRLSKIPRAQPRALGIQIRRPSPKYVDPVERLWARRERGVGAVDQNVVVRRSALRSIRTFRVPRLRVAWPASIETGRGLACCRG